MGRILSTIVLSLFLLGSPSLAQTSGEYRQRGLSYRNEGQLPEAIEALEQAVKLEPEHLSGRVLLGWTVHLAGDSIRAGNILEQNRQRDPFHGETLNALGIVYLVQGKLWAAVGTHAWAAALKPHNEIAFYNLSLAFQRLGLYDWSIATAEYASFLEPSNPHPLVALALAYGSRSPLTSPLTTENSATQIPIKKTLDATIALDDRYRDSSFLEHLEEAGFSREQIAQVEIILNWYNSLP